MSFDCLAPHYRWMEWILAGRKLQHCRTFYLDAIPAPQQVLLVGEGNGRFLIEVLRKYPAATITCIDASEAMLVQARARLEKAGLNTANVQWIHANLLEWQPPKEKFDLIVTCFFLDCFTSEQLSRVVETLARSTRPHANWLLADFCEPPSGCAKWRAAAILSVMYLFFRVVTRIPAARLVVPDGELIKHNFSLKQRKTFECGLLHSDLWSCGKAHSS